MSFTLKNALTGALLLMAPLVLGSSRPAASEVYSEPYRPQYHFSPAMHWMNDPNGMIYFEGEYHLFYQYNPKATVWGPMHWGHAVSPDMLHWKPLPVALSPDSSGMIFSGSVVYDPQNTSGLGKPGEGPLVAIYTRHDDVLKKTGSHEFESQNLAFSLDRGRTWVKYHGNPVLPNPGRDDFRDPKVFWFAAQQTWVMALAVGDHVSFYSSPDLKAWKHESDFGRAAGAHSGVWECPDLVALQTDAGSAPKYVLLVSISQGAPNGGSGTQYFVGDFDGHRFMADPDKSDPHRSATQDGVSSEALWLDYGTDDYAGVTWSHVPDGRALFIGWMSNWTYAQEVPSRRWRSAMTLPRELRVLETEHGWRLRSTPVAELDSLRTAHHAIALQPVRQEIELTKGLNSSSGLLELDVTLQTKEANLITFKFENSLHEVLSFRIDRSQMRYELDRAKSGRVNFDARFKSLQTAPITGSDPSVSLRIFLDRSSAEIFINGGESVMTALTFPSTPYTKILLTADRTVQLTAAAIYALKSSWAPP